MFLKNFNEVFTLLDDFVLARPLAHSEVSQVGQSKAPHVLPRVPIGPDNP